MKLLIFVLVVIGSVKCSAQDSVGDFVKYYHYKYKRDSCRKQIDSIDKLLRADDAWKKSGPDKLRQFLDIDNKCLRYALLYEDSMNIYEPKRYSLRN